MPSDDDIVFKGNPAITTAVVLSTQDAGGHITVRLENWTNNDIGSGIPVKITGGVYPSVGDRGLIIFKDQFNQFNDGFWLGSLANRFYDGDVSKKDHGKNLPADVKSLISNNGEQRILVSDSEIKIAAGTQHISLTPGLFQISNVLNSFTFDNEGLKASWSKNDNIISKITISPKIVEIGSDGTFLLRTSSDFNIRADGNIVIGGNSNDQNNAATIHAKANKIILDSGSGALSTIGSAFNVKVGASVAGTSGGAPGSGTSTAASIEVVQGNMDFSVGSGDIFIRALSVTNKIRFFNGSVSVGPQSFVEMNGTEALIGAEMASGSGATIKMTRAGAFEVKSLLDTKIDATQAVKISAMTNAEIKAIVNMVLEAVKLDIKASTSMAIETAMLDLKKATMIDAGPKIGVPGIGPFCSIPVCPLTGIVHTSAQCM